MGKGEAMEKIEQSFFKRRLPPPPPAPLRIKKVLTSVWLVIEIISSVFFPKKLQFHFNMYLFVTEHKCSDTWKNTYKITRLNGRRGQNTESIMGHLIIYHDL